MSCRFLQTRYRAKVHASSLLVALCVSLRLPPASRFGSGNASGSLRLDIINSTVNIDARLVKLYELLENDVLASLSGAAANCAPYKVWGDVGALLASYDQQSAAAAAEGYLLLLPLVPAAYLA